MKASDPSPIAAAEEMARRLAKIEDRRQHSPQLEFSGGGGDSTDMEARVAKLEAHMEHVRADVGALKADVSKLKVDTATLLERVGHLPSKSFIVTSTLTALAVLGALTLFAPNLQRLLGL